MPEDKPSDEWLRRTAAKARSLKRQGLLPTRVEQALQKKTGWTWDLKMYQRDQLLQKLAEYYSKHQHIPKTRDPVPANRKLATFFANLKKLRNDGSLPAELIAKINAIFPQLLQILDNATKNTKKKRSDLPTKVKKKALLMMALQGQERPHYEKHTLGKCLWHYRKKDKLFMQTLESLVSQSLISNDWLD